MVRMVLKKFKKFFFLFFFFDKWNLKKRKNKHRHIVLMRLPDMKVGKEIWKNKQEKWLDKKDDYFRWRMKIHLKGVGQEKDKK